MKGKQKRIAIIGGGVSGLTAGIYALKHGFSCAIYEKNARAGGECTDWKRQGYTIDGCINWLCGCKEGDSLNRVWKTTGALEGVPITFHDSFFTVELGGKTITWYRDVDKLRNELLEKAPEDKEEIEKLCTLIRDTADMDNMADSAPELMNPAEMFRMIRSMKPMMKYYKEFSSISIDEFGQRFTPPLMRRAITSLIPMNYSGVSFIGTMGPFAGGNSAWPSGGSGAFARRLQKRFEELGGELHLNTAVRSLAIENGITTGIVTADGTTHRADYVISACDMKVLLDGILGGKYPDKQLDSMFADTEKYPLGSAILVALGVDCDLSARPRCLFTDFEPFDGSNRHGNVIGFEHYAHEKSFAPEGSTVLIAKVDADEYDYYSGLSEAEYCAFKDRAGKKCAGKLAEIYPETAGKITVLDVVTPLTFNHWCGAYRGAFMSFPMTAKGKMYAHPGKIKGIDNLYLASQWVRSIGGLPGAAMAGKWAVQRICRKEKIRFDKKQ